MLANRNTHHLMMPCCQSRVTLKRSPLGTQFFAHKAIGDCTTAPETESHLRLKQMAVQAARDNGWAAETEVTGTTPSGEQWKADVLASRNGHKVAFEIQWSPQTRDETRRRQTRYAQSGVRCLWLFRQSDLPVDQALPVVGISGEADAGFVALVPTGAGTQAVPMEQFLEAALSRKLRFGIPLGFAARVGIWTGKIFCWRCGAETEIVTSANLTFGPHEYRFSVPHLGKYPVLFDRVRSQIPVRPLIGNIKRRFSKTQERSYLSNGCVHCDALIGEYHEHEALGDPMEVANFGVTLTEQLRQVCLEQGDEPGWGVYLNN